MHSKKARGLRCETKRPRCRAISIQGRLGSNGTTVTEGGDGGGGGGDWVPGWCWSSGIAKGTGFGGGPGWLFEGLGGFGVWVGWDGGSRAPHGVFDRAKPKTPLYCIRSAISAHVASGQATQRTQPRQGQAGQSTQSLAWASLGLAPSGVFFYNRDHVLGRGV